ncbi:MAG TPA: hypothetical protein VH206_15760 [Xanthobacteraceae bacterium]|nr:hypothetical protein [Xanthobacteraceae bacterium]
MKIDFGFEELDELAFATASNVKIEKPLGQIFAKNLGTIIELQQLIQTGLALPDLDKLADTRRVRLAKAIKLGQKKAIFEGDGRRSWLMKCCWENEEEPDDWHDFCCSLEEGAVLAGFPKRNAQELVAATRELVSNIFDHSGALSSGIAGFSIIDDELEIVVADSGIGVLESLRTSPEFSALRDSGEALQAALADGVSRFGKRSGHGGGFRDLFRGLINLNGNLRFRSGDHALNINGVSLGLSAARISQKVQLPGFIISIMCDTRALSRGPA